MAAALRIDTRDLSRWVKREMEYTKKDLATAINWHGFKICKAANRLTHQASGPKIRQEMRERVQRTVITPGGKTSTSEPPRAALLVQFQRKRKGLRGLYGAEMAQAVEKFISRRVSHRKFLGAGFLPGVAAFGAKVGAFVGANAARWAKNTKVGDATVATPGINPTAKFWNDAMSPPDQTTQPMEAMRFKEEALQRAVNQEVQNLERYVARQIEKRNAQVLATLLR